MSNDQNKPLPVPPPVPTPYEHDQIERKTPSRKQ